MLKGIPIGREDFRDIRENNLYYIDKTKFIEDILLDGTQVKLFCRPRRFGKTLNMSTLKYFFDIKDKEKSYGINTCYKLLFYLLICRVDIRSILQGNESRQIYK